MTPPSLDVARKILAEHAASNAYTHGDEGAMLRAAIDIVLDRVTACEAQEASVHGAASVIKVAVSDPQRDAIAGAGQLVPVFESCDGRDRGDASDVVASCEASRLVTIKEFALINEPPWISVGYVIDDQQVKALRDRVLEQRAVAARHAELRKLAADAGLGEQWAQDLIDAGSTIEEAREGALRCLIRR